FSDHKTDNPHFIPILSDLKKYIEKITNLPIYTNQVMNRGLSEISQILNLKVKPTMHLARHTFAVRYLDNGGSMEVLQKLLGHKKIGTTQIYGKITDKRITDEFKAIYR